MLCMTTLYEKVKVYIINELHQFSRHFLHYNNLINTDIKLHIRVTNQNDLM